MAVLMMVLLWKTRQCFVTDFEWKSTSFTPLLHLWSRIGRKWYRLVSNYSEIHCLIVDHRRQEGPSSKLLICIRKHPPASFHSPLFLDSFGRQITTSPLSGIWLQLHWSPFCIDAGSDCSGCNQTSLSSVLQRTLQCMTSCIIIPAL